MLALLARWAYRKWQKAQGELELKLTSLDVRIQELEAATRETATRTERGINVLLQSAATTSVEAGCQAFRISINQEGNSRTLAQLWVSCRPGHQLSAKIKMPSQKDLHFVRGELAPGRLSLATGGEGYHEENQMATDPEFALTSNWGDLGGSLDAASYFKTVDAAGPFAFTHAFHDSTALASQLTDLARALETLTAQVANLSIKVDRIERNQIHSQYPAAGSAPSVAGSTSSQYDVLADQIPPLPGWAVDLCSTLREGRVSKRDRALRAWEAGNWAKFVLEGKIGKPRPSTPCDLANQVYVVLKAEGFDCPLLCETAAIYRSVVKDFKQGTLSHGFASRSEAKEDPDAVYLLNVEALEGALGESIISQVLVLLRREGGVLLALPTGAISEDALSEAAEGNPFSMFGPHTVLQVPARHVFGEQDVDEVEVLVADSDAVVFNSLSPMPVAPPDGIVTFAADPGVLPVAEFLMSSTRAWLVQSQEDPQLVFYSAAEDQAPVEEPPQPAPNGPTPKPGAKPKAKRVTTSSLAAAGVNLRSPPLADSSDCISTGRSRAVEGTGKQPSKGSPAESNPAASFRSPAELCKDDRKPSPHESSNSISSAPCASASRGVGRDARGDDARRRDLSSSGVGTIQGTDQFGQPIAAGGSIAGWASKRMKPASKPPTSIEAAQNMEMSMVTYLEKFGGYGACREMGLVQYSLAHAFDSALNDDMDGVREHLALTMTAIEQAVQDGNRWDLAYQLTLLEEPPNQLWGFRPAAAQSRLRAFAPLCAQRWATVALAYAKELDYIQNRKRDDKEISANSSSGYTEPISKAKAKKEAEVARRRKRKLIQRSRRSQGLEESPGIGGDPSPSSSMSARPRSPGTVIVGRGEPPNAHGALFCHAGDMSCAEEDGNKKTQAHQFSALRTFPEALPGKVPVSIWVEVQVRRLLASRTAFSLYLLRSITLCREGHDDILSTALFPIPFPFSSLWDGGPKKMNSKARQLRARRKLLHISVMALNYLHDRAPLACLGLLRRRPNQHHVKVYRRLMTLIKASVLSDNVTMAGCGRKSFQLDARVKELFQVLVSCGLDEKSKYHQSSAGAPVDLCNDKAEELRPYRCLQASCLKLTGKGQWDCVPFLSDLLYMPFLEPKFNEFDILPPKNICPNVLAEDPDEALRLAKVWDAQGLLRLIPSELCPLDARLHTRVFNNFKNSLMDRQIGDRRGRNFVEGRIDEGPSHSLPTGVSLLQIMPQPYNEGLKGYVTDRKDFYHQFQTSWERSRSNVIYPLFPLFKFHGLKAYDECKRRFSRIKQGEREEVGDFLHGGQRGILVAEDSEVAISFAAVFQGDHLGVEVACSAHEGLLSSVDLLNKFKGAESSCVCRSGGKDAESKDVCGEARFKVVGAEIDSRDQVIREGAVVCGIPAEKRLALASVAAVASSLPYTSDALHSSLVGSVVSAMLFRRPLMAILNHVFKVIPPEDLDPARPVLRPLSRAAAEELAIVAAVMPVMCANLAARINTRIYATDASNVMGGIAHADVEDELARFLWRSSDKKGANVPLLGRAAAILHTHDEDYEATPFAEDDILQADATVHRPIGLRFQFCEVFGGAGVVTKYAIELGIICAPVLDISHSKHYDIGNFRVIQWINFMLEEKRILAVLLAPPCTTFSPAAYPSLRSYENPLGFDRTHPRVLHGNLMAGAGISVLLTCRRTNSFGMLEQTRRPKMKWTTMWTNMFGLGASEISLASCSYGSIHMKEFSFLGMNMDLESLARPCTRDHQHVRIEGKYTKASATYTPELAKAIAQVFKNHLDRAERFEEKCVLRTDGLEDPISNDVAVAYEWHKTDAWRWKGSSHINLLETASTLRLMRKLAKEGGDSRTVYLGDSHVSRSSMMRGRTSSDALRPFLKQNAALSVGFGLYMAGRFSPTRSMPADHPSRDVEIPPPVRHSILRNLPATALQWLEKIPKSRRWVSNWVRLVLLIQPNLPLFFTAPECFRIHPATYMPPTHALMDFDATLGFPGEGPGFGFMPLFLSNLFIHPLLCRLPCCHLSGWIWVMSVGVGAVPPKGGFSHGDEVRKAARAGITLGEGRRTTETTVAARVDFTSWLAQKQIVFDEVFMANPPNLDAINQLLTDYGRFLFYAGKPYFQFSETINSVSARRPVLRRSLQQAWDLGFL
eukprot:s659_g5.t1